MSSPTSESEEDDAKTVVQTPTGPEADWEWGTHAELRVQTEVTIEQPEGVDLPDELVSLLGTHNPWTGPLLPLRYFELRGVLSESREKQEYGSETQLKLHFQLHNLLDQTRFNVGLVELEVQHGSVGSRVYGVGFYINTTPKHTLLSDLLRVRLGCSLRGLLPAALRTLLRDVILERHEVPPTTRMSLAAVPKPNHRNHRSQHALHAYYEQLGFRANEAEKRANHAGDAYIGGLLMEAPSLAHVLRHCEDVCHWSTGGRRSVRLEKELYWVFRPVQGDAPHLEGAPNREYSYERPWRKLHGLEPLVTHRRTADELAEWDHQTQPAGHKHHTEHDARQEGDAKRRRMQARMRVLEQGF